VSQSSEFCRHNTFCCFWTSVCCCKGIFRYDSVRKLLDTPSYSASLTCLARVYRSRGCSVPLTCLVRGWRYHGSKCFEFSVVTTIDPNAVAWCTIRGRWRRIRKHHWWFYNLKRGTILFWTVCKGKKWSGIVFGLNMLWTQQFRFPMMQLSSWLLLWASQPEFGCSSCHCVVTSNVGHFLNVISISWKRTHQ